ncbi:MAG: hypothetical protein Q4D87_05725 [Actinomycetaceae bacterium]|nr:hypothetical protein [Actinomycetaceae bacterium]
MADQVINEANAEMVRAWRAAMVIGRFMAARREQALRNAQQSSIEQERALRRVIDHERALAQKVYERALNRNWWSSGVTQDDAIYVYGLARRFSDIDPQAELAARRCEREAKERWNIDVRRPIEEVEDIPSVEEAIQVAPMLETETVQEVKPVVQQALYRAYQDGDFQMVDQDRAEAILDYVESQKDSAPEWLNTLWRGDLSGWLGVSEQVDARIKDIYPDLKAAQTQSAIALGQASHAREVARVEQREATQAVELADEGNNDEASQERVDKEVGEAKSASRGEKAAWDSASAREAHAQALLGKGSDPAAVQAAMTADKALHRPAREATRKTNTASAPRSAPQAKPAARTQTRRM